MIWGKTFVRWLWHVTSAFASVHNDDPDNNCHRNHSFALSSNVARKISLKCHRSTVQSLPWSIWNVCCFRYPNPPGLRMELRSLLIVITAVIQSQFSKATMTRRHEIPLHLSIHPSRTWRSFVRWFAEADLASKQWRTDRLDDWPRRKLLLRWPVVYQSNHIVTLVMWSKVA